MSCAEPLQMTRDFFDKFNIAYTVLRKSIPVGKVFFYHQSQIWKLFFRIKTQSPTYVQKTTTGSFNSLRKQPKFWTPPMVSPQTDVWGTSTEIPYWWRFTSQILSVLPIWSCGEGNFLQLIKRTTQVRVVTRHQYGISVLVSQTSFRGETSGGVAKCRLFSQATLSAVKNTYQTSSLPKGSSER